LYQFAKTNHQLLNDADDVDDDDVAAADHFLAT
jgi:hypothetical protein